VSLRSPRESVIKEKGNAMPSAEFALPFDTVDELDLECIITKLTASDTAGGYNWPVSSARKVEEAYRSFLKSARDQMQCGAETSVHLQPTHVVDIFWHTHILFTRKYFKDCEAVFGQYLHHEPVLPSQ
jgi:hypothetical protein